jgi:anaerobic selenocysteine-containing dehydrogenase
MGFDEPCFSDSDEALARAAFGAAVSFDALRERGWQQLPRAEAPFADGGFPTASGRARVDCCGLGVPEHVPNHESVLSAPELARRFPLAMISPPARHFLNSSFVNVKSLRAIEGEPVVEIHPDDAVPRGITSGALVRIFNGRGDYRCKAEVSRRARPGVVNGLGVWWRKFGVDGTNVNEVTSQALTDIGRAPTFYDCLVQVEVA